MVLKHSRKQKLRKSLEPTKFINRPKARRPLDQMALFIYLNRFQKTIGMPQNKNSNRNILGATKQQKLKSENTSKDIQLNSKNPSVQYLFQPFQTIKIRSLIPKRPDSEIPNHLQPISSSSLQAKPTSPFHP